MKTPLALIAVASILAVALPTSAPAEPAKIDHVVELLQQAKESDRPVPLLEKARAVLKDFHPSNPKGMAAAGIGRRKAANISIGENEKKQKAMEAITEAIKTAKEGGNVKPKIESAIAHTHSAG